MKFVAVENATPLAGLSVEDQRLASAVQATFEASGAVAFQNATPLENYA